MTEQEKNRQRGLIEDDLWDDYDEEMEMQGCIKEALKGAAVLLLGFLVIGFMILAICL